MSWSASSKPPLRDNYAAYDPAVIQQIADDLYRQADAIVSAAATKGLVGGGLVGAIIGGLFLSAGNQLQGQGALTALAIWGAFGAGIAYAMVIGPARRQALQLRYQAQVALCQMRIEANTRQPASL